eukprot:CAMPEP_0167754684 /NCGR_PEP_ID=MMETSP0110_2-20121227/8406_1 /TAXON_ID=629695 /ORGANISM="Gymnochlora sp., Strain CCMP2014" /LENGTH=339 /DNA_ID=CAMNT_0007640589 /DNA_START=119 /DNA_END=1138 /DNA_ORIENTATION=-
METLKYAAYGAAGVSAYHTVKEPAARVAGQVAQNVVKHAKNVIGKLGNKDDGCVANVDQDGNEQKIEESSNVKETTEIVQNHIVDGDLVDNTVGFHPSIDVWPPIPKFRVGDTCWYPKTNITVRVSKVYPPFTKDSDWVYEVKIEDEDGPRTKQTIEPRLQQYRPSTAKSGDQVYGASMITWDVGDGDQTVSLSHVLRKKNVVLFSLPNFDSDETIYGNNSAKQLESFAMSAFDLKLVGVDVIAVVGLTSMDKLKTYLAECGINTKVIIPIADETGALHRELGLGVGTKENELPSKSQWWALYLKNHRVRVVLTEPATSAKTFNIANAKSMLKAATFAN